MASIRTHTQWPSAETSLYDVQVFNDEKLRIERGNFMSTNGSPGKEKETRNSPCPPIYFDFDKTSCKPRWPWETIFSFSFLAKKGLLIFPLWRHRTGHPSLTVTCPFKSKMIFFYFQDILKMPRCLQVRDHWNVSPVVYLCVCVVYLFAEPWDEEVGFVDFWTRLLKCVSVCV